MERIEGPKGCEEHEFGATLDLLNLVFRTSEGRSPDMGQSYPHMYRESNRENLRIIKVNGKVISHVGIFPAQVAIGDVTIKVGGIGGVATHPDYRQRGYAGLLLKDCIRRMEEKGFDLSILWTGINDYYRRFGWENGGCENVYLLDRGNISLLPELRGYQIEEGIGDNLEQIHSLHEREPLRVIRDKIMASVLLSRPGLETYTALRDSEVQAYLTIGGERVLDYGGIPEAVAGLIRDVFKRKLLKRMDLSTPSVNYGLPRILDDLRIPKHINYLGMLRIINLGSLLEKLGLTDIAFEEKSDEITLSRKGDVVRLNRRKLVKLIFGPERVSDFGKDIFPVSLYWWRLDHM